MINKLDTNQLIQLALHATGINTILLEALQNGQALNEPCKPDEELEAELDVFVTELSFEELTAPIKQQTQSIPKN